MAEACVGIGQRDVECSDGDTRFSLGAAILGHHDRGKFTDVFSQMQESMCSSWLSFPL